MRPDYQSEIRIRATCHGPALFQFFTFFFWFYKIGPVIRCYLDIEVFICLLIVPLRIDSTNRIDSIRPSCSCFCPCSGRPRAEKVWRRRRPRWRFLADAQTHGWRPLRSVPAAIQIGRHPRRRQEADHHEHRQERRPSEYPVHSTVQRSPFTKTIVRHDRLSVRSGRDTWRPSLISRIGFLLMLLMLDP